MTVIWWVKPKVCHFNGICLIFPLLRDLCSFPCTLISFSYFFIVTNWFFLSSISSRRYFHTVQEDTQSIMKWPYHKNAAYLCWGFSSVLDPFRRIHSKCLWNSKKRIDVNDWGPIDSLTPQLQGWRSSTIVCRRRNEFLNSGALSGF